MKVLTSSDNFIAGRNSSATDLWGFCPAIVPGHGLSAGFDIGALTEIYCICDNEPRRLVEEDQWVAQRSLAVAVHQLEALFLEGK